MKKALLLLLVASPAFAEVKTKLYPSGALAERFDYVDRRVEHWADNCQIVERGHLKNGKRDGAWTTWTEDGAKQEEGSYADGVREGVWTFYGPKGEKQFAGPYVHGIANGHIHRVVRRRRQVARRTRWRTASASARRSTPARRRAAAGGRLRGQEEGCLVRARSPAMWTGYYPTGAVRWRSNFTQGYRDGHGEELHPTGELLHEGEWLGGIPEGTHRWQSPTGKAYGTSTSPRAPARSTSSRRTAATRSTSPTSTARARRVEALLRQRRARRGDHVSRRREDRAVQAATTSLGDLMIVGREPDGRARRRVGRVLGQRQGEVGGRRTIAWAAASACGRTSRTAARSRRAATFVDDREYGPWMYFHDSGKLEATGMMVDGLRSGTWQTYFADGKPWRTDRVRSMGREAGPAREACYGDCPATGSPIRTSRNARLSRSAVRRTTTRFPDKIATGAVDVVASQWPAIEKQGTLDSRQAGRPLVVLLRQRPADARRRLRQRSRSAASWQGFYRGARAASQDAYEVGNADRHLAVWYESGAPLSEGRYDAGKKSGAWTYYDRSGKPEHVTY